MDIPVDASWSNQDYEIKEQDRFLPIANVGRVMKNALPPHAKLSKGSKVCIQECVSEFISFVTSQAVDKCKIEKRKTLNGEDILWAMYTLGFENYSETLKIYLAKYREFEQLEAERKPSRGRRKKVEDEDNYETDFLSKDLSPTNSDNTNNYLKLNEGAPGFNLSNFSENQSASINYLLPNSNSNSDSRQPSNGRNPETSISNFEDFVEGINY